jgi:hypothetical protein
MGFQSVEEEGDRQQVGAAARAEVTSDKCVVHCCSDLAPVWLFDTA